MKSPAGTPIEGYKRTAGADPIALPGTEQRGHRLALLPDVRGERAGRPGSQTDPDNVKTIWRPARRSSSAR